MTPEQIKQQLIDEYGFTPEALAGMTPEEIQALWEQYEKNEQFASAMGKLKKFAEAPEKKEPDKFGSDELRGNNQDGQIRAIWHKDPHGDNAPSSVHADTPPAAAPTAAATPMAMLAEACKTMAEDPKSSPESKMFAKAFTAMYAENEETKKRVGELQAAADADREKTAEAKMALFAQEADKLLVEHKIRERYTPLIVDKSIVPQIKIIATTKTFSSETDRATALREYITGLAEKPINPQLATAANPLSEDPNAPAMWNMDLVRQLASTETMRRRAPNVAKKVLAAATNK